MEGPCGISTHTRSPLSSGLQHTGSLGPHVGPCRRALVTSPQTPASFLIHLSSDHQTAGPDLINQGSGSISLAEATLVSRGDGS